MGTDVRPDRRKRLLVALTGAFLMAVSLFIPMTAKALDDAEKWSLFREGESSFRQANEILKTDPQKARELFSKAALCYERIVREGGVENGKIFYNIGNIYFRLGDLGRAILNYKRAEEFIPGDPNLQQNIDYARSRCVDKIEAKPKTQVLLTLFFWHYDLSMLNRSRLFVLFFGLVWVSGGVYLLRRREWIRYTLFISIAVSLFLFGSIAVEAYGKAHSRSGVILEKEVIARKGDSTTYEPSFKEPIHAGAEFRLLEERPDWLHIELADGRQCWIPDSAAEMI